LSAFSDAFAALKNVLLMQERLDSMRSDIGRISGDLKTLTEKVGSINDRVIRIETMIEMTERQATQAPRIEG
jgi:archaellum component FlaC